jgi:hypothetical protein
MLVAWSTEIDGTGFVDTHKMRQRNILKSSKFGIEVQVNIARFYGIPVFKLIYFRKVWVEHAVA